MPQSKTFLLPQISQRARSSEFRIEASLCFFEKIKEKSYLLSDFGIQDKDIPELAAGVMKVTRLLANNPRELTQKEAEAIYRSVL